MSHIPRLERRGPVVQLIVDGQPFLIRGGELGNSSASSLTELESHFEKLSRMNLNTVLVPVYWDRLEPEEGKFDFTLVQGAVDSARRHSLRIVLLWFGTWKNSMSCYAPSWMKRDPERFFRVRTRDGAAQEIVSPACADGREADLRAYVRLLDWLADYDGVERTVLMIQIENEIGMIPEPRDFSPASETLWESPMPSFFGKGDASWKDAFGESADGAELFSAWQFATSVEPIAKAGKAVYPLPTFTNAALIRPGFEPGRYPSGGPLPHLFGVWKEFAPSVDFLAPDIYFPNFAEWAEQYYVEGEPMLIPELAPSARMSGNVLYAISALGAIGACPFAIEDLVGEKQYDLAQLFARVSELEDLVTSAQAEGRIIGLTPKCDFDWLIESELERATLSGIVFDALFDRPRVEGEFDVSVLPTHGSGRWEAPPSMPLGGVMLIQVSENEFIGLGKACTLTFANEDGGGSVGIDWVRAGDRWLNGDQTHQGRHIRFPDHEWSELRFALYCY